MENEPTLPPDPGARKPLHFRARYLLLGGALALAFSFVLGALASASGSMALAAVMGLLAYFLAGLACGVIEPRPSINDPRFPALGAAIATSLLVLVQLGSVHRQMPQISIGRLLIGGLASVIAAFGLTWLGTRAGQMMMARRREATVAASRERRPPSPPFAGPPLMPPTGQPQ